jgi:hypothetical protein
MAIMDFVLFTVKGVSAPMIKMVRMVIAKA